MGAARNVLIRVARKWLVVAHSTVLHTEEAFVAN
jgi:hypothetical protein